jgi:multiple sugar transport system ATP-binding protein
MPAGAAVRLRGLVKSYLDDKGRPAITALKGLDLDVADGELMVLVGPSGCGKTTTLRLIAGLEAPTSGTIEIGGRVVNQVEPKDRGVAMVFQNYALYPHMTAFENMAFGLKLAKVPKAQIRKTVLETAATLELDLVLERKPPALSGGQRQRVALGRALARNPSVFLLDEPLSNLDAQMRVQLRAEIARLHTRLKATMIYVTHDQVEAMTLGDRICVLNEGTVMQVADPITLYGQPANRFVAGFIGSPPMNLLSGQVQRCAGALCFVANGEHGSLVIPLRGPLEPRATGYLDKPIVFGVRPEHLAATANSTSPSPPVFPIEFVEHLGAEAIIHLKAGERGLTARVSAEHHYHPGESFPVHLNLEQAHLFDPDTGNSL